MAEWWNELVQTGNWRTLKIEYFLGLIPLYLVIKAIYLDPKRKEKEEKEHLELQKRKKEEYDKWVEEE